MKCYRREIHTKSPPFFQRHRLSQFGRAKQNGCEIHTLRSHGRIHVMGDEMMGDDAFVAPRPCVGQIDVVFQVHFLRWMV